jgi:hypothetical protein
MDDTTKELRRIARMFAEPIQFVALIRDCVLKKKGGGWYEILDWNLLPEHARRRIYSIKSPNMVKFYKTVRLRILDE